MTADSAPSARAIRQRVQERLAGGTPQSLVARQAGVDPTRLCRCLARDDEQGLSDDSLRSLAKWLDATDAPARAGAPLPEAHAHLLAEKLESGRLALFVGSGLSRLAPRKDGSSVRLPLWHELARAVAGDLQ